MNKIKRQCEITRAIIQYVTDFVLQCPLIGQGDNQEETAPPPPVPIQRKFIIQIMYILNIYVINDLMDANISQFFYFKTTFNIEQYIKQMCPFCQQ